MFKKIDVSGDGVVSVQELQSRMASLPARSRDQWKEVMDEMDKDGSGEIEFDEFDAVVRTRQTRSFCSLQFLLLSP
jgi:Ca2+-binding EF-hand superfamily protein